MQAYPDDYEILDGFEALAMIQECAETTGAESERRSESEELMQYADNPERKCLVEQAHRAMTPEEWEVAWETLLDWKQRHPDDVGIEDTFEMLALLRSSMTEKQSAAVS